MERQTNLQRRSAARTAVVWGALRDALADASDEPLSVVDVGGGTGELAVRVAELGHRVTVVDPNPDALAILARRAEESGVADRVVARQGDLATVPELFPDGSADVVLCHGVLEIVEDPADALRTLARLLRPAGTLSLLVLQRHAAVLTRAMAGHFAQARSLLDAGPARPVTPATPAGPARPVAGQSGPAAGQPAGDPRSPRRFTAEEVTGILVDTGFEPRAMHAVRVFVDLVPSSLVDLEPGAANALVELEQAVATRPEYLPLGTQIHTLATRR
jgi:S-adenosylmethionine-dependent methyltransferase